MKAIETKSKMMKYLNDEIFSGKYSGERVDRIALVTPPFLEPNIPLRRKWNSVCGDMAKWCGKIKNFNNHKPLNNDLI